MATKEDSQLIGLKGQLIVEQGELGVDIEVLDIKYSFGRMDVLVRPIAGCGTKWASRDRVSIYQYENV